tara:strand:- start:1992 stop:3053 length:1062 start_codon:yes stop_codon:yes gene_type:complete
MKLALEQARINLGNTGTNPSVGCVITKNNSLVSAGYTGINGRPHAEINAINFTDTKLHNAILYATLEPCSHFGKTPPCIHSIAKKKIKKVFFSIKDPDSRSFDKSTYFFKKKGINVNKGIYSEKIYKFYKSYYKFKLNEFPFVTAKLAISKDFYTINKRKKWITNTFSRGRVHMMRSENNCILTSSNTVIKDNPRLTCRIKGLEHHSPYRIVLDKRLRAPINSHVFSDSNKNKTIVFYNIPNIKKINTLKKMKIKFFRVPLDLSGDIDLKKALIKIKKMGFYRVFLECGKSLTSNFLKENLVDEFKLFVSNKKLLNNGRGNLKSYFKSFLKNKKKNEEIVNLFGDKLITYKIK